MGVHLDSLFILCCTSVKIREVSGRFGWHWEALKGNIRKRPKSLQWKTVSLQFILCYKYEPLCSWANRAFQRVGMWLPPNQTPPYVSSDIWRDLLSSSYWLRWILYCRASNSGTILSVLYLSSELLSLVYKFPCLKSVYYALTFFSSLDLSKYRNCFTILLSAASFIFQINVKFIT